MTLIAHVSDTHFGTELLPVCAALRTDLLHHSPDLVVLTGDITQRARSAQFRAARIFMDSLQPIPVLALPGNHDLPLFDLFTRFTHPYRLYRRFISRDLAPAWQSSAVVVLGVNSTRPTRHKNGELPDHVVRQVAKQLQGAIQPFKIVALHHPLAVVQTSDQPNRARGAEAALAAWAEAGADLFLGGHIHLPYCITVESGRAVLLQAGTGVSWRRRGGQPNSYNLIRLENDCRRVRFEQRDYDDATEVFAAKATWEATRAAAGWVLPAR